MTSEMKNMEIDPLGILQTEFPTLDPALIAAILSDTNDLSTARQTLEILKPQTILDDGALPGFDSCPELCEGSSETDLTWRTEENDEENPPDKIDSLRKMFPELGVYTLKRVLSSAQGHVDRAIDELLNREFLNGDEDAGKTKGVDAFDGESGLSWGGKKSKRKGRGGNGKGGGGGRRADLLPDENSLNGKVAESCWAAISREVDYLADCLGLEREKVLSVYHSHGGSIGPMIVALLDKYQGGGSGDVTHQDELHTLAAEFGATVKTDHLDKLLSLCRDNKTAVFELAGILSRTTSPQEFLGSFSPAPSSAPSPSSPSSPSSRSRTDPRQTTPTVNTEWTVIGRNLRRPAMSPRTINIPRSHTSASINESTYASACNEAFAKASAAYRKSKSDRLMSGAAAVYSEQGHEYNSIAQEYNDIVAERWVDENSSEDTLDLHGVTVRQALKISRERTTQWWVRESNDGERRQRGGTKALSIVTGCGRHSKDGSPKLLPAVGKMLVREGWDIQVQGGQITVWGVRAGSRKPSN
ncbi:hypothetical protein L873DRAFT_1770692 [Choiromyces venosus 120613-1]|uniref:Smr domain-containing protein n=1 Tax=Choiromyces venosus 120613-1 TaxID=1336337 RepID=A0A3N4JKN6_9PEZI|nr:hypothetical protein L873DRAFT_1770692 [Choiromyces venosus 120613-1]